MRVTKKKLLALTAALALCVCATLALKYVGVEGDAAEEQAKTYYLSGYASVDELMAVSIENPSGEVVLVHFSTESYALPENGLAPDGEIITELFDQVYQLPLNGLLEGASASDPQFGLMTPSSVVTFQDVHDGGLVFYLGSATPDGGSYYACLSGDERVFTMGADYARWFLSDVSAYYDMSLVGGTPVAVEVRRGGETVFALEQMAAIAEGGTAQYVLTAPYRLPVSLDQAENALLAPLEALTGTRLLGTGLADETCGITAESPRILLRYADGGTDCLKVGGETEQGTVVTAEKSGLTFLVPTTSLSFALSDGADIVGTTLLQLNINQLAKVTLNDCVYQLTGANATLQAAKNGSPMAVADFQEQVLNPLNGLSVYGEYDGEPTGALLLTATLETRFDETPLELRFYETDGRSCTVAVDGENVFLCGKAAVETLALAAGQ